MTSLDKITGLIKLMKPMATSVVPAVLATAVIKQIVAIHLLIR